MLTWQEMLFPGTQHSIQFHSVHATLATSAADEVRQRVAWSLAQVVVVAEFSSAFLTSSDETWTYYYDIVVRNAFGSYLDILREVTT